MKIIFCDKKNIKEYLKFVKETYSVFPKYKDYFSPILKQFLCKKGKFCSNLEITPIMIKENNSIVAVCMYIVSKRYSKVLQIAFFEAREGYQGAVDLIMEKAKEICRTKELHKIVVGLNGHVNYGIGFLCDKFDAELTFGSSFNPPYYASYFLKYNPKQYKMTSFCGNMKEDHLKRESKILDRVHRNFNYRNMSFKNFRRDMKFYTDLNNLCFKQHPFYFERTYEEDYELFKELKYFIKEENIIFVQKEDKPIGYMLWYPDFNELIDYGKSIGVDTYIKNKLFSKKIKKLKIVEIAILPQFQKSGAIVGLFNKCYKKTLGRYEFYESSWIFEENFKSKNFGVKWAEKEYKHYVAFEIPAVEEAW